MVGVRKTTNTLKFNESFLILTTTLISLTNNWEIYEMKQDFDGMIC